MPCQQPPADRATLSSRAQSTSEWPNVQVELQGLPVSAAEGVQVEHVAVVDLNPAPGGERSIADLPEPLPCLRPHYGMGVQQNIDSPAGSDVVQVFAFVVAIEERRDRPNTGSLPIGYRRDCFPRETYSS